MKVIRFYVYQLTSTRPKRLIEKTEELMPYTNGSLIHTPQGDMIVVRHYNDMGYKGSSNVCDIYTVPINCYAPVRQPKDSPDAVIGYYRVPFTRTIVAVEKSPYVRGDNILEEYFEYAKTHMEK